MISFPHARPKSALIGAMIAVSRGPNPQMEIARATLIAWFFFNTTIFVMTRKKDFVSMNESHSCIGFALKYNISPLEEDGASNGKDSLGLKLL